ncbi:hypothetical protein [Nannocystis radixulma]|uniref:Myxococcus cysteine-rich repeat-containing protein n=1 Tax=Nannocystis radixulma TaxID=2995305 RepID=A0ABT5BIV9_9BACT|nr:hypothetical protein [Nannocystis radixulma]MDC0672967.1 hypothetical protein [Nannocystis radixulma]
MLPSGTSNPSGDPPPGSETQPCVDGLCLGELACLSDVCVDPGQPMTGGTTADEPTTGGSATSGPTTPDPATSEPPATSTTDSPETSTGTPSLCGNGEVDDGEECDDANDKDQGDTCSNSCTDTTTLVKYINVVKMPLVGMATGAYSFDDLCTNGLLTGHNAVRTLDQDAISQIVGYCEPARVVHSDYPYLYTPGSQMLEYHGVDNDGLFEGENCNNRFVTGLQVYLNPKGEAAGWRLYCADVKVEFTEIKVGTGFLNSSEIGGEWGTEVEHPCPPGSVAIGYHGNLSDTQLVGVGLTCGKPVP